MNIEGIIRVLQEEREKTMNEFFLQYAGFLYIVQLFFAVIIGLYFWNLLKNQQSKKVVMFRESEKEKQKIRKMREIKLSEPLSSLSRPTVFNEVIGQDEGINILRSALCGPNPQHVLIYGPPGVGKTAAARLVLEEARKNNLSPFRHDAKFIEVDATISRCDERNIADPLIGSVHDPIYQGAGAMGSAGIPQPKEGACTKAHGGILFIDEIGELHPMQMNKLLKVLEDRKVILESAYYSENDKTIPTYIHDIFINGLPADFRLVGATTRIPEELPSALRSRCMEVFFKPLDKEAIRLITANAAKKINYELDEESLKEICRHVTNGREAVNIVQLAAGIAQIEKQKKINCNIIQKVLNNGRFAPRPEIVLKKEAMIGMVNGLAVYGANVGTIIEVEAAATPSSTEVDTGKFMVTGVVEEEHVEGSNRSYSRKSMAKGAVENVLTVLRANYRLDIDNYNIHLNFPGGIPVDGPSAGIAIATVIYSAVNKIKIDNYMAMTGEVSVHGVVKPVGGIISKIEAARVAGIKTVLIPADNYNTIVLDFPNIRIIPVRELDEVLKLALVKN